MRGCRGQSSAIQVCRRCRDGPMRKRCAVWEKFHQLASVERATRSNTLAAKEWIHSNRCWEGGHHWVRPERLGDDAARGAPPTK